VGKKGRNSLESKAIIQIQKMAILAIFQKEFNGYSPRLNNFL
jgi:hypothetical protein